MTNCMGSINDATILDLGAVAGLVLIVIDSSWLAFITFLTVITGFYLEKRYGLIDKLLKQQSKVPNVPKAEIKETFEAQSTPVQETKPISHDFDTQEVFMGEDACMSELGRKESQEPGAFEAAMKQYEKSNPEPNEELVEDDDCFRKMSDMMKHTKDEIIEKILDDSSSDEKEKVIVTKEEEVAVTNEPAVEEKQELSPESKFEQDSQPKIAEEESTLSKVESLLRRSSSRSSVSSVDSDDRKEDFVEGTAHKSPNDIMEVAEAKINENLVDVTETSRVQEIVEERVAEQVNDHVEVSEQLKKTPAEDLMDATTSESSAELVEITDVPKVEDVQISQDFLIDVQGKVKSPNTNDPLESIFETSPSHATEKNLDSTFGAASTKTEVGDDSFFGVDFQTTGTFTEVTPVKDHIEEKSPSSALGSMIGQAIAGAIEVTKPEFPETLDTKVSSEIQKPLEAIDDKEEDIVKIEGKIELLEAIQESNEITDVIWKDSQDDEHPGKASHEDLHKNDGISVEDIVEKEASPKSDPVSVTNVSKFVTVGDEFNAHFDLGNSSGRENIRSVGDSNDILLFQANGDQKKSEPGEVSAMVLNAEAIVQSNDDKDKTEFK